MAPLILPFIGHQLTVENYSLDNFPSRAFFMGLFEQGLLEVHFQKSIWGQFRANLLNNHPGSFWLQAGLFAGLGSILDRVSEDTAHSCISFFSVSKKHYANLY